MDEEEKINQETLKSLVEYNPDTGIFSWVASENRSIVLGSRVGHLHHTGYVRIILRGKNYVAHRLAWLYMTGKWPKEQIDHINGIRKDNRWCNLREATNQQNCFNTKISNSSTGIKGVTARGKRFRARIGVNYKDINLGTYKTKEEARMVYQDFAKLLHGEFYRE